MLQFRMTCVAQKRLCLTSLMSTLQYTGRYQIVLPFTRGLCDGTKLGRANLESGSSLTLDMFLCHFLAQCEQVFKVRYRIAFRADIKNSPEYRSVDIT